MLKKFIDVSLKFFDLSRTVDRQGKQIADLEKQMRELQREFERFVLAYEKNLEQERTEREKMVLQFENILLRRELELRQRVKELPPAGADE